MIVWDIRLPYALMAVVVGFALGLAGAEMQTILNNPLASPFTLGVSSAAAFGAALAIVLGIGIPGIPDQWFISANAFIFALFAALMLDGITRWTRVATSGVVLFGIALVFTFNALVSMMQFIASEDTLQGLVFWTMGSLARASWDKLGILFGVFAVLLPLSMMSSWKLTALRLGEDRAVSFGIDVRRLRLTTLLRISMLSALAVAFVGPIGFIGLVAPHIARMIFGEDHRFYLPASALIGALVLSMASVASKNLVPGVIIPVGIVTLAGRGAVLPEHYSAPSGERMNQGLRIEHFSAGYPKRQVIDDLSVPMLPRGQITVLLGRTAAANRRCCARWPG
ncbi:Probable ABC transporter permease protein HI_1471 [Serratia marcescens]|uniref:Probable ABC transporter permease protein HI_1471 n=1 Tax=Serratia marcescens TaxID=615 RepID=A0A379Z432_SERMA|nr:Probable ABC transporter permease protein HI_1471 [Serratia marcescens]